MGASCSAACCPWYRGRLPFQARRLGNYVGLLYCTGHRQYTFRVVSGKELKHTQTFVETANARLRILGSEFITVTTAYTPYGRYRTRAVFQCAL